MRSAKHQLETADHDFDGHCVKAIEHLDHGDSRSTEICMSMHVSEDGQQENGATRILTSGSVRGRCLKGLSRSDV